MLDLFDNKWRFHHFCERLGLNVPPTQVAASKEVLDFSAVERELGLPFIVKPLDQHGAAGLLLIASEADYREKILDNNEYRFAPLLVQRYVRGIDVGLNLLAIRGKVQAMALAGVVAVLLVGALLMQDTWFRMAIHPPGRFATSKTPKTPDYASRDAWAIFPDAPPPGAWETPWGVDVFFIHSTSAYAGDAWNEAIDNPVSKARLDEHILPNQAAPFLKAGPVYAPRYRQAALDAELNVGADSDGAFEIAYDDVLAAFDLYLKEHNRGRGIIVAGVGQGGLYAIRLVKERFQGGDLKDRLAAALGVGLGADEVLPGGGVEGIAPPMVSEEEAASPQLRLIARGRLDDPPALARLAGERLGKDRARGIEARAAELFADPLGVPPPDAEDAVLLGDQGARALVGSAGVGVQPRRGHRRRALDPGRRGHALEEAPRAGEHHDAGLEGPRLDRQRLDRPVRLKKQGGVFQGSPGVHRLGPALAGGGGCGRSRSRSDARYGWG